MRGRASNRWEAHWSAGPEPLAQSFNRLEPADVVPLLESLGLRPRETPTSHGSVENRVYSFRAEGGERLVLKLYRPGRWSAAGLVEERRLLAELRAAGVPVVRVVGPGSDEQVGTWRGIYFLVFEFVPSRARAGPWEEAELRGLGRLAARVHQVSRRRTAVHRMDLEPRSMGLDNLEYLERGALIPARFKPEYIDIARAVVDASVPLFEGVPFIRVHGDFGVHNLLHGERGVVVADFDDFMLGPAVFDLCRLHVGLVTPWGDPNEDETARRRATEAFVRGYREVDAIPDAHLRPGPALRALRMIWNDGWKQGRLHDAHFRRVRAVITQPRFWRERLAFLRAQLARIHQP